MRERRIAINSNRITTIGIALLFVCTFLLLLWNVRELLLGRFDHDLSPVFYVFVVAIALRGAFIFPEKPVRVAFLLIATNYALRFIMHYLDRSFGSRHAVFAAGSIMKQVAFVLLLWAIAKWFKSVVQISPADDSTHSDTARLP